MNLDLDFQWVAECREDAGNPKEMGLALSLAVEYQDGGDQVEIH